MKLTFEINDTTKAIITKDSYGYNLEIRTPPSIKSNKPNKKGYSSAVYYYPSLDLIARKVAYLGLEGDSVSKIISKLDNVAERITDTLTKGER